MEQQGLYQAALYCRLSQDDGQQGDSSSIQTQKMMLEKYCKDNNFGIHDYYVDDGFSGTNFNRPSFQRLLKDIDNGIVNLVITKDLSRLGRDYIMVGYYTEIYFSDKRVRYIAVNDAVDTLKNDNDIAPFKNILNDMYAKDLSRKIRASRRLKATQGMFTGSNAPYGYRKDPTNKNKLLIVPETAAVVRRIFDMMLSGYGATHIARVLTQDQIFTPAVMKAKTGDTRFERFIEEGAECRWYAGKVYKIVTDPSYTGATVSSREQVVSYKTKKVVKNKKDKWIIVPNMHEAIITQEEFDRAQKLVQERHLPRKKFDMEDLFSGLVKCADCGRSMVLSVQKRYGKQVGYYRCFGFRSIRAKDKHWTTIKYDDLKIIVAERLKKFFALFKNDNELLELVRKRIEENNISVDCEKHLSKLEARQNVLTAITKKVYDDYFEGLINHETYLSLVKKYQDEQNENKKKIDLLKIERDKKKNYLDDFQKLKELVHSFLDLKTLTREMVYNLIEKIEVTSDGGFKQHKQRTVKITYRFLEIEL